VRSDLHGLVEADAAREVLAGLETLAVLGLKVSAYTSVTLASGGREERE
jgi:hypothetical protein